MALKLAVKLFGKNKHLITISKNLVQSTYNSRSQQILEVTCKKNYIFLTLFENG